MEEHDPNNEYQQLSLASTFFCVASMDCKRCDAAYNESDSEEGGDEKELDDEAALRVHQGEPEGSPGHYEDPQSDPDDFPGHPEDFHGDSEDPQGHHEISPDRSDAYDDMVVDCHVRQIGAQQVQVGNLRHAARQRNVGSDARYETLARDAHEHIST